MNKPTQSNVFSLAGAACTALFLSAVAACGGNSGGSIADPETDPSTSSPATDPSAGAADRDGGTTLPGPTEPRDPASETDCREYASTLCSVLTKCYASSAGAFPDQARCEERGTAICMRDSREPGSGYTKEATRACLETYKTATCEAFQGVTPTLCRIKGQLEDGETCVADGQCKSATCGEDGDGCGVCKPRLPVGSSCGGGDRCTWGSTCAGGKCVAYKKIGEGCSGESEACSPDASCVAGTCAKKAELGEACATGAGKTAPGCNTQKFLWCDTQTEQCAPVQVAPQGQKCGYDSGNITTCKSGDYCKVASGLSGVCAQAAGAGMACSEDGKTLPSCDFGLHCIDGKCGLPTTSTCRANP